MIQVIKIPWNAKGSFKDRPNRFLGIVDITSPRKEKAKNAKIHVHDPGRLRELLYPKNQVLLRKATNPNRKTEWDLIAANWEGNWVLVHSGFHRQIAQWFIENPKVSPFGKLKEIRPEASFGNSRLDFLLTKNNDKRVWVEVKGCTLAQEGVALFPDAPTERGARHIKDLIKATKSDDGVAIMILVFRPDAECFAPHEDIDFKFANIFWQAMDVGVEVHALRFRYEDVWVLFDKAISVC